MTEDKYQYPFDIEAESEVTPPPTTVAEPQVMGKQDVRQFLQIMQRLGVGMLCLLALSYISRGSTAWTRWTKQYFHLAVNASTGQTFGKLLQSQAVQIIMANSRNLLRLKTVNRQSRRGLFGDFDQGTMANSVWPTQGRLIQRFGWEQTATGQNPQFSKGVVVAGISDGDVVAIHSGKVVKIDREPDYGWVLEVGHSEGWRSVYHNLDRVVVQVAQYVQTGDLLGKLSSSQEPRDLRFWLELYQAGRLIDPLTIIGPD
jgi:murein DD-endopeptidase MepM/ murein hydrolase activator NlpD